MSSKPSHPHRHPRRHQDQDHHTFPVSPSCRALSAISNTTATTVSQRILPSKTPLDLPELLTLTFQFLACDNNLYPAMLVNRQWHACASRVLWRQVGFEESQLAQFEKFAECFGRWTPGIANNQSDPEQEQFMVAHGNGNHAITPEGHGRNNVGNLDWMRRFARETRAKGRSRSGIRRYSSSYIPTAASIMRGRAVSSPATPSVPWTLLRQKQPQAGEEVVNLDDLTISSPPYGSDAPSSLVPAATRAAASLLPSYRSHLRAFWLRKFKGDRINDPLLAIAKHARNLTSLDIYICDKLHDSTVLAFVTLHHPISPITHLSLAGCNSITDAVVFKVAEYCPNLQHLDLRACSQISDTSIIEIANSCSQLRHLNVGRIRDRGRITADSILPLAMKTQITVLGLAGCDVSDDCMLGLAEFRGEELERISVNNCPNITDRSLRAFVSMGTKLSVLELKECYNIADWEALAELVQRKVLLTMCETQKRRYESWAMAAKGRPMKVRAPTK